MIRLALLSNVNMDLLAERLRVRLNSIGIECAVYVAGYDQYVQEIMDAGSSLNKGETDAAILFLDGEELFKEIIEEPLRFSYEDTERIIDGVMKRLASLIGRFTDTNKKAALFVNNIFLRRPAVLGALAYNGDYGASTLQERFNSRVSELKLSERVVVVDFAGDASRYGYDGIYDDRLWCLGRIRFSGAGLQRLAELYSLYINAYLGGCKKVIVLDLDNTLWGGIVGEDGIDGLKLGPDGIGGAFLGFQRLLKTLKEKGVLLAVCSKNNAADVKEVFDRKGLMELKESDFAAFKVNWEDKAKNIMEMARELNLGLEGFVFIDDSPFEREALKSAAPQVTVPDFPEDPSDIRSWFIDLSLSHFNSIALTGEDRRRTEIYRADAKRRELSSMPGTIEDFYMSLEMRAAVKLNSRGDYKRIAQLTQRTNQFNLTTRRYAEADVLGLMSGGERMVFSLELSDRFGDGGIVGAAIVREAKDAAHIETFLLSCRVIGRTVEEAFLARISAFLKGRGVRSLMGEYAPSKKNSLVREMYGRLGFRLHERRDDGRTLWEFDLASGSVKGSGWIRVEADFNRYGGEEDWRLTIN